MKHIPWKNYLITGVIAIIVVKVFYPLIQPTLAKIPVVGGYFPA
jgi:hypothetical protein